MTVTSQGGIFGFGLQDDGLKGGAVQSWYRHKALMVGAGAIQEKAVAPPEIGGPNNPTGAYKSGAMYGGRVSLQPRLEGDLGWLLLAMAGNVASGANATTGFSHTFSQRGGAGGGLFLPFMGVRRLVPGRTINDDLGEIGKDIVMSTATFNFPQVGPLSVDMDFVGREWELDDAPDLWTWADITESYDSVPMVMKGSGVTLPSFRAEALPITAARVMINNGTTTPQEERIIGSYHPDDYAVRQRVFTVELTYKWDDPEFCRFILNGGDPADRFFEPCIDFTDLLLTIESPCDIEEGVTDFPWKLSFQAPRMDWNSTPLQLAGDEILTFQIVGTAIEASTTDPADYFEIVLDNAVSAYPLPAAP
jgi:hypothetical protein